MISKINLKDSMNDLAEIGKIWTPVKVAKVNDQVVRMGLGRGEYHWHKHTNEDELFFVIKGELTIQLRDEEDIILHEGEITVIPKGIEHCPKCSEDTYLLMFEPYVLQSRGD